jgi:nucleotide-binding universal stress UspA family protein
VRAPQGIDHLVLSSRGLGSFKRALYAVVGLGSVSDYVLHHAPCAVTVVPEPPLPPSSAA